LVGHTARALSGKKGKREEKKKGEGGTPFFFVRLGQIYSPFQGVGGGDPQAALKRKEKKKREGGEKLVPTLR